MVVQDGLAEPLTLAQVLADPAHGLRVGARPLQHLPRLAPAHILERVAGHPVKTFVHPNHAAFFVGEDHGVGRSRGHQRELAQLVLLRPQALVGGLQLGPLLGEFFRQLLTVGHGRLARLQHEEEIDDRIVDGKVLEPQAESVDLR